MIDVVSHEEVADELGDQRRIVGMFVERKRGWLERIGGKSIERKLQWASFSRGKARSAA